MAQEANGLPYASANPSGVGAVYFEPYKVQEQHQKNLDSFLEGVNARKDAADKKKEFAMGMLDDMAIDPKNIMNTDVEGLSAEANDLQNYYAKMLQQDIDPENPAFVNAYKEFQQKKQSLQFRMAKSEAERKMMEMALGKFDPEKHDDAMLKNIDAFNTAPLDSRQEYAEGLIVNKKPSLQTYLAKYHKPFADKLKESTKVLPADKQGVIKEKSLKYSLSPTGNIADYATHAQSIMADPEGIKAVNETWGLTPDSQKKAYIDAYIAKGMPPSVAEVEAKKDMVSDNLALLNVIQESEVYKGQSEGYKQAVQYAYEQKKESNKGRILPEVVAQMKLGDPAIMKKTTYKWPVGEQSQEVYGTRALNGYNLGEVLLPAVAQTAVGQYSMTKDGDKIVTEKVQNYPTLIFTDDDGNIQMSTVESETLYKVGKSKSPFIPFQSEGALLSYLQSASGNEQNTQYGTADQQKKYLEMSKASRGGVDYDSRMLLNWQPEDDERAKQARSGQVIFKPVNKQSASKPTSTVNINGKKYNVSKAAKGYQISKDGKKAKITYSDNTTEIITL